MSYATAGLVGATLLLSGTCAVLERDGAAEDGLTELVPLTVPVPQLRQLAVSSSVGTTFGQRCIVSGGDIGVAANALFAGNDSQVAVGGVLLAPRVVLGDRISVGPGGNVWFLESDSAKVGRVLLAS